MVINNVFAHFYCYKIPDAGYFIKKRGLFSSQFWRLKVQGYAGISAMTLGHITSWEMASWQGHM
jgi:hypothetical protein